MHDSHGPSWPVQDEDDSESLYEEVIPKRANAPEQISAGNHYERASAPSIEDVSEYTLEGGAHDSSDRNGRVPTRADRTKITFDHNNSQSEVDLTEDDIVVVS